MSTILVASIYLAIRLPLSWLAWRRFRDEPDMLLPLLLPFGWIALVPSLVTAKRKARR